jgi:hypothetical protein
VQAIYASLEADFPADPEAWDLRARRWLSPLAQQSASAPSEGPDDAAIATYEVALAATEGPEMFDLYRVFLTESLERLLPPEQHDEEGLSAPQLKGRAKWLAKQVFEVQLYPTEPHLLQLHGP